MTLKETITALTKSAKSMRVLYVEDEELIRENTKMLLESIFGEVVVAQEGQEGLQKYQNGTYACVISDILMPRMNGVAMLRAIKAQNPAQHCIVTSACEESSYLLELINLRISHFMLKPIQTQQIIDVLWEVVSIIENEQKAAILSVNEEIWQAQHEILALLGEVGETRSHETGQHVRRVAHYSQLLGELYGLDAHETRLIYSAAPMHDIGKIGIPDAVLLKNGKLDSHEFGIMQEHSRLGYEILKNSHRPLLQAAAIIAHEHHERWDGSGYPRGLAGEDIHIYGRIVALADVFDALSCERVYKKAWQMEQILEYVTREQGKHFDPRLVELFLTHQEHFLDIAHRLGD